MLDLKLIRTNPELVRESLRKRGEEAPLDEVLELDNKRRAVIAEVEELKAKRNEVSEKVATLKREKKDATEIIAEMKEVSQKIKDLDEELREIESKLEDYLLRIPNIPHPSVPEGASDDDNVVVRQVGHTPSFDFEPLPHWEIGVNLGILDFERGGKVTGTRFYFLKGLGARLERALINFMLDVHTQRHGYTEVFPPFIVNKIQQ